MASLIVSNPTHGDVVHDLKTDVVIIGRHPDDEIYLSDESVSSHHAKIIFLEGRFYLHDLFSTNGTKVNGQRIAQIELHDRDAIRFGKAECSFVLKTKRLASLAKSWLGKTAFTLAATGLVSAILLGVGYRPRRFRSISQTSNVSEFDSPAEVELLKREAAKATESEVDECLVTLSDASRPMKARRHAFRLLSQIDSDQAARFSHSIFSYTAFYLALQYTQGIVVKRDIGKANKLLERADQLGDQVMHDNVRRTRASATDGMNHHVP